MASAQREKSIGFCNKIRSRRMHKIGGSATNNVPEKDKTV